MDDKLLIRVYAVGFGDCIYVRIPDGESHYHVLIDCGTSDSAAILKKVLDDVFSMLPKDEEGKKRLDLLVATHPHADHIKGSERMTYEETLVKVKEEFIRLIDEFLIGDFGIDEKDMVIVFSGGRGYHASTSLPSWARWAARNRPRSDKHGQGPSASRNCESRPFAGRTYASS